jgi:hypothetical protein
MQALYHLFSSVVPPYESFEQFIPSDLIPAVSRSKKAVTDVHVIDMINPPLVMSSEQQVKVIAEVAARIRDQSLLRSLKELQALIKEADLAGDTLARRKLVQQLCEINLDRQKVFAIIKKR